MPVEVSVKDVRLALRRAAQPSGGDGGNGQPATLLLGSLFHEVFADLVSTDEARSGIRVLVETGEGRETAERRLVRHIYDVLVGPRLSRHQAHLNEQAREVMTFWQATQNLAIWLTELVLVPGGAGPARWQDVAARFAAEQPIACELREPGWTEAVRLSGIVDSLIRPPGTDRFCALELKLGRAQPPVDLGQAALYRLIAARSSPGEGALALLRFSAEREEIVINASQVAEAEARLIELIGKLAGVSRKPAPPPPVNGLGNDNGSGPHAKLAQNIVRAYREFGRSVELSEQPVVGPRFLRFEIRPGKGVTVDQVHKLTPEVGIRAGLPVEPMVNRIDGRLWIDLLRPDPQTVPFSIIREQAGSNDPAGGSARLPVGLDPGGKLVWADLSDPTTPHVLVAGSAGSGKSEWLRMAIGGLMVTNTSDTLRFAFIDPKISAFNELRRSRWLLHPSAFWVPGEGTEIVDFLEDLVAEMDRRYRLFAAAGADDLAQYLARGGARLPRLVCFCDEYFALITTDRRERKEVEGRVSLLGAKGRAAGVHLVIATQQASREVIKGALDANLPCRVGLRVTKALESRLLLEADGAERLTGHGDLLFKAIGDPVRLQAPYLSPPERAALFAG